MVQIKDAVKKFIAHVAGAMKSPVNPASEFSAARVISCSRQSLNLMSSSAVVFHIATADVDGYFYECRRHEALKDYVRSFIEDYYMYVVPEHSANLEDKKMIISSLDDSENFRKFVSMGIRLYGIKSSCMEFLHTGCANVIGLNADPQNQDQIERLKKFVGEYAWCQLNSYKINRYVAENSFQSYEANLALAAQEISRMLKIDYIIPKAEYIRLVIDGEIVRYGLFAQKAEGCSILPYSSEERKKKITPSFQRELMTLNMLDIITLDQDHSPNNYNVIMNENGCVVGVSSFDNKSAGAFALRCNIDFLTYKKCSAFARKDGTINRPYLSKPVAMRILSLKFPFFYRSMRKYLLPTPVLCAWIRVLRFRKAIQKTLLDNRDFLLEDSEWNQQTLDNELSGAYGKTYLISYYSDVFLY